MRRVQVCMIGYVIQSSLGFEGVVCSDEREGSLSGGVWENIK